MTRYTQVTVVVRALALSAFMGALGIGAAALADDTPPPANSTPGNDGPSGRHHNPAWQACKKQADDQKLEPGDARKEFMKNCMDSAKPATPPAS